MFRYPALIRLFGLYLLLNLFNLPVSRGQIAGCNCKENLNEVINKVKDNYPGYPIKITQTNETSFKRITDSLRNVADTADAVTCFSVLQSWLGYFKDRHLALIFKDIPENKALISRIFANGDTFPLAKDSLIKRWKDTLDSPLEGIWTVGNIYEVAVVKKGKIYLGIILNGDNLYWRSGQIKFELEPDRENNWKVTQYNRYHQPDAFISNIDEQSYSMDLKGVKWEKIFPSQPDHNKSIPADSFYFIKIDSNNAVLRLPSFELEYKTLIDSMITHNFYTITHTPHLIVDLRGNVGGFNLCFEKLLPLIYTGPVITAGAMIKASPENIKLYEDLLLNPQFPDKDKEAISRLIINLKKYKNGYYVTPADTVTYPQVYQQPEKVGLLIDEGCASATEFLILDAKQSKKVTLFGKRSAGVVDYSNLVGPRALVCSRYLLWVPTARSARLPQHPIDNTGIMPDVELPHHENWITYVQQYLANLDIIIATSSK